MSGLDAILQVEGLAAAIAHELKLVVYLDNACHTLYESS